MFNSVTEALIKKIPSIYSVDIERLPQYLTCSFARIIGLRAKYRAGENGNNNKQLKQDLKQLEVIANTLEFYLVCYPDIENRKSIAYVSAVARKLIGMIQPIDDTASLSLHYLPVNLSSMLLFIISGNFADAKEIADNINFCEIADFWIRRIYETTRYLIRGELDLVNKQRIELPSAELPTDELAEKLMWYELILGIQHLGKHLITGDTYQNEEFEIVKNLSTEDLDLYSQKEIYVGSYLLATFYKEAAIALSEHAVINLYKPPTISSDAWYLTLKKVAKRQPFLWDNHIEGIQKGILNPGVSAIITFPTGAGKTTLSKLKIITALELGKRCLYLVPTHALEYQVEKDLSEITDCSSCTANRDAEYSWFDEEDENKQIMVMTPEHCLTILKVSPEKLYNIGLVVFDEFHLISGELYNTRAVDSMHLLTLLLASYHEADFFLLSAMVKNSAEIAEWISASTGRDCKLLDSAWKPTTQLQGCVVYEKQDLYYLQSVINDARMSNLTRKTPSERLKRQMKIVPKCLFCLKSSWDTSDTADYYLSKLLPSKVQLGIKAKQGQWILSANYNSVAAELAQKYAGLGLKTIVFAWSPQFAVSICKHLDELIEVNNTSFFHNECKDEVNRLIIELGDWSYSYLSICLSATIHHSLLLPEERILSEKYFKQGGVAIMTATPTIAQGVNLPADVVIIAGTSRFDERTRGFSLIKAHEILNAAGRAGRAGYRSHGTVIVVHSLPIFIEKNIISRDWTYLKDEIFSKGDRCLVVKDPFEIMLKDDEFVLTPYLYNCLTGSKEQVYNSLSKSFYAYKMIKEGDGNQLETRIEYLSQELSQTEYNESWIKELSIKTGVSEDDISILYNNLNDDTLHQINQFKVLDIFDCLSEVLLTSAPSLHDTFLSRRARDIIKDVLGLGEQDRLNYDHIEIIYSCTGSYMIGKCLYDIELELTRTKDGFLKKARKFVLRAIPEISYIAGVLIQIVITKMQHLGIDEVSNEVKTFASCIKEGVTSYDMLMAKYANKWMRVECHQKFRN